MDGGAESVGVAPPPDEPVQPAAAARTPPVSAAAASLAVRANLVRMTPVSTEGASACAPGRDPGSRSRGPRRLVPVRDGIMEGMPDSDSMPGIDAFVAIGDSFTEGLNDPDPGGGFRGWADRVADALSAQRPGFRYANLAIRGKLVGQVVAEQVPRAVELAPDLVSLAAGGNDILSGADVDVLASEFEPAVAKLQAAGCRVLIFTGFDPRMFPVIRLLRGRIAAYNMHLRGIADDYGCDLVDLWSMRVLKDARAWSPDRLHLTTEGHRRVALRACEVLGVPVTEDWRLPLPPAQRTSGPPSPGPRGWPRAARTPAGPGSTPPRGCAGGWAARPAATACRPSAPTCSRSEHADLLPAGARRRRSCQRPRRPWLSACWCSILTGPSLYRGPPGSCQRPPRKRGESDEPTAVWPGDRCGLRTPGSSARPGRPGGSSEYRHRAGSRPAARSGPRARRRAKGQAAVGPDIPRQ